MIRWVWANGEGAVLVDVGGVADMDLVAGHGSEDQQEEHAGDDPEQWRAQLLAKLEGRDGAEHPRSRR
jgi:hypothetical protein